MTSPRASQREAFVTIALRASGPAQAERAVAEAYDAGAIGLEERVTERGIEWVLYAPESAVVAIQLALADRPVEMDAPLAVPVFDWAERWKAYHQPVEISPRLRVRPSFAPASDRVGQRDLVIDPGAAFGTGSHESTRLALEWIDVLAPELRLPGRVLDVGTGTGVLGLAAVALAPVRALGFDLDPLATAAARDNARCNGLEARFAIWNGGFEAVDPAVRFVAIFANLLRRELSPLLSRIAASTAPGAAVVVSGLLEGERAEIEAAALPHGLRTRATRSRRDASGERWVGLLMRRTADASRR